jgi:moderate conductance mechanosensitive channel
VTLIALQQSDIRALVEHAEATLIELVVAFAVWRLALAAIDRIFARRFVSRFVPRVSTFCTLTKSIVGLIVVLVAAIGLLHVWSVDVTPAVWSAGFITAALAFGSQTVVRDIVTGFFFLFEDQYDVGDRVELVTSGGQVVAGTVESMGLRTTGVIDRLGRMVVVPNGNVALVTNGTRLPSLASFSIALEWHADATAMRERVAAHVREIVAAGGDDPGIVDVSLTDITSTGPVFSVELRSNQAELELRRLNLRERLAAALQAEGWLPAGVAAGDAAEHTG